MKKLILVIGILIPFSSSYGSIQFHFKPEAGEITYKTKGWPNLVVIEATGKGVEGVLVENKGKVSGELSFDIATFESGIKSRDTHALNYMEAEKFPKAKIKFTDLIPPKNNSGSFKFKGQLTFHGVEKPIEGQAEMKKLEQDVQLSGNFILNFKDFNVVVPAWNGITVAEKVEVRFESKIVVTQQ